jgi:hypothetical protein
MADYGPISGESAKAFASFCVYRDLGPRRSLAAVADVLRKQHDGPGGIRLVSTGTGNEQAAKRQRFRTLKASGQLNSWSRKYSWGSRAAQWDGFLDRHLRSRQLERIERFAEKCLTQVEIALDAVMQPIIQAAKAYNDPARLAELEEMPTIDSVRLGLQAALAVPKLQESARLACRVISAPDSPTADKPDHQAEWRVSVYAPSRAHPMPEVLGGQGEPLEWEDA